MQSSEIGGEEVTPSITLPQKLFSFDPFVNCIVVILVNNLDVIIFPSLLEFVLFPFSLNLCFLLSSFLQMMGAATPMAPSLIIIYCSSTQWTAPQIISQKCPRVARYTACFYLGSVTDSIGMSSTATDVLVATSIPVHRGSTAPVLINE